MLGAVAADYTLTVLCLQPGLSRLTRTNVQRESYSPPCTNPRAAVASTTIAADTGTAERMLLRRGELCVVPVWATCAIRSEIHSRDHEEKKNDDDVVNK